MAHKTLIGGTAYEITGGKTLVDGTAYSIKSGKTLVGGTAYEVGFAPTEATVAITQNLTGVGTLGTNAQYASVTIDGITYDGSQTVYLTVPVGTKITCSVAVTGNIYVNKDIVDTPYEFTVQKDTTVAVGVVSMMGYKGTVRIIDASPVVFHITIGLANIAWCESNSTWNDLDGTNGSGLVVTITDGKVYATYFNSTYRVQLNGVDVKPTDTITHLAQYTSVKV